MYRHGHLAFAIACAAVVLLAISCGVAAARERTPPGGRPPAYTWRAPSVTGAESPGVGAARVSLADGAVRPASSSTTLPTVWIFDRPVEFFQATVTTSAVYVDQVRSHHPLRVDGMVRNDNTFALSHMPVMINWLAGDGTILQMDVTFVVSLELKPGQEAGFTTDVEAPAGATNVVIQAFGRHSVSPATDLALASWSRLMPPAVGNPDYTLNFRNDSTSTVVMPSYGVPEFAKNVSDYRFMDFTWDIYTDESIAPGATWPTDVGGGMNWSVFTSMPGAEITGTIYGQARCPVETTRIAGGDRYDTAVRACRSAFETATTVVIASGENFPDALAGASIAGAYDAPLLLTRKASLYSGIPVEIERLGATRAVILGGTGALSSAIETGLEHQTSVTVVDRIAGGDRYDTAALIATRVRSLEGTREACIVVRGDTFPDALAAAPMSFAGAVPVFLVKTNSVPANVAAAMAAVDPDELLVVGGSGAVASSTADSFGIPWTRIAGATRYRTASELTFYTWTHAYTGFWTVGIASGKNFPDALAGGVALGKKQGIILLTDPTTPDPDAAGMLSWASWAVYQGYGLGGTGAVTGPCWNQWEDAMAGQY